MRGRVRDGARALDVRTDLPVRGRGPAVRSGIQDVRVPGGPIPGGRGLGVSDQRVRQRHLLRSAPHAIDCGPEVDPLRDDQSGERTVRAEEFVRDQDRRKRGAGGSRRRDPRQGLSGSVRPGRRERGGPGDEPGRPEAAGVRALRRAASGVDRVFRGAGTDDASALESRIDLPIRGQRRNRPRGVQRQPGQLRRCSERIPEVLFVGRDAIEAGGLFGQSFWYYSFNNPATGQVEPKTALSCW